MADLPVAAVGVSDCVALLRPPGTTRRLFFIYRCGQPAQQQGRRMPPDSLEIALPILMPRVSAFLPEITQHIHSLRAKGVVLFHTASALGRATSAARKSLGSVCTVLVVAIGAAICTVYQICVRVPRCKLKSVHQNTPRATLNLPCAARRQAAASLRLMRYPKAPALYATPGAE